MKVSLPPSISSERGLQAASESDLIGPRHGFNDVPTLKRRERRAPAHKRAFTLVEVMIALALFFIAVFAILGVVNQCLKGARLVQKKRVDCGSIAAKFVATLTNNVIEEGLTSGDFDDDGNPGYKWDLDALPYGTNGLYEINIVVHNPRGEVESTMTFRHYVGQQQQGNRPRSPFGAGIRR